MKKTIIFLLILFFVLIIGVPFTNPAFAQAIQKDVQVLILQLQEQIKDLQEQITKLQAELSSTKTELEAVKTELKFTKALRLGARGNEVKQLQEFLKSFPDIYPQGLITGYFGPLTEIAVRRFQEKQGIESIGIVGPKTLSKLNELITEGAGASSVIPPGLLTAPGIQKKLEATTTTPAIIPTIPVGTTTTPISIQPIAAAPTGICLIKDIYTDIPPFSIANFGNGFAKYVVGGVNTVSGLKTACTKTIYDYLLQTYCKSNSNPVQRLVSTYNYQGIGDSQNLSCGSQGCDFADCSSVASLAPIPMPTTTLSGTIPATPATPATPAQPISATGTSTVPAISATPAQPAATATTTTTTTTTIAPSNPNAPIISNRAVVVSSNGARITWITNINADSLIYYSTVNASNLYGSGVQYYGLVTSHLVTLSNLTPNTSYLYKIQSSDGSLGNATITDGASFTTLLADAAGVLDTTPPVISGVRSPQATLYNTSAGIEWETNEAADSDLEYGLTANYGSPSGLFSTLITSHSIGFSGLTPETTYHYRVKSKDAAGNLATSGDYTFQTLSNAATYPTLSVSSNPSGATVTNINSGYIYCQSTPCSVQVVTQFSISANIKVSKSGYYDWTNLIYLNPKTTTTVNATLLTLAPQSSLSFTPNSIDNGQGSWQTAKSTCNNLGARLPTVAELRILNQQKTTYSFREGYADYWSSEESGDKAYYIHFDSNETNGFTNTMNKTVTWPYFRCVKDGTASTPFSSILDTRTKNMAAILQIIGSLSETLEKLSQLLK